MTEHDNLSLILENDNAMSISRLKDLDSEILFPLIVEAGAKKCLAKAVSIHKQPVNVELFIIYDKFEMFLEALDDYNVMYCENRILAPKKLTEVPIALQSFQLKLLAKKHNSEDFLEYFSTVNYSPLDILNLSENDLVNHKFNETSLHEAAKINDFEQVMFLCNCVIGAIEGTINYKKYNGLLFTFQKLKAFLEESQSCDILLESVSV